MERVANPSHGSPCRWFANPTPSARAPLHPFCRRFDEHSNVTRRRGWRFGWLRWAQTEPPYHYEHSWFQVHMLTWDKSPDRPAVKVQFEVKTYRTAGMRSIDGSKRYIRFGVCL